MPRLDGRRVLAPASLLILLPEQSLDIRLLAFFRPPYREQMRGRNQRLLQRVRFRTERAFQIAYEIQPPIDEFRLGIVFSRRLGRLLFVFFTLPEEIEPRIPGAIPDRETGFGRRQPIRG